MRTIPTAAPPPAPSAPAKHQPSKPQKPVWRAAAIMDDPCTAGVLHSAWSGDPAVVVPSPPGAGKTRLVALLAATLADRAGLRVGIAAQTRDQAVELARRVGALTSAARLVWNSKTPLPSVPSVVVSTGRQAKFPPTGGGVLIATTARWIYFDTRSVHCDLMVVDEAWQATYADLGALGAFAGQIVCVGDPGQIAPVVTGQTRRWATSPTGPHLPGPQALIAAHPAAVSVVTLRHTWRLGPDTTRLIQPAFYPGLPFTSKRPPEHLTGADGSVLPEVAHRPTQPSAGPSDPLLTAACAELTRSLLGHTLHTAERSRPVQPSDLAVVCAHVAQAASVRARLADLPDVLVGTANQLQGMERPAVVALHPLAGYREPAGFSTDPGRACVMLTRHRAHLTVVTDDASRAVLNADPSPATAVQTALLAALAATPAR